MRPNLKPISAQVIVITGASSGINLVTARMAANAGGRVVLAARNEQALREICDGIRALGHEATYVVADVGNEADVRRIADKAIGHYGGFDTWVNGAAAAMYARLDETSTEDHRRLFDTNYWGVVYGCRTALEHLRTRGGAIINIGSVLSDRSIPLQGAYAAAKHAVKAYTDTLRMEVVEANLPVSVTLIKPGSIDTPYIEHAQNQMAQEPRYAPPIYAPRAVAEAVLYAAQHPIRSIVVGGGGRVLSTMGMLFPRLTDRLMQRAGFSMQQAKRPGRPSELSNLHEPYDGGRERSAQRDFPVFERSLYTRARLHPTATGLTVLGLITAMFAWRRSRGRERLTPE